MCLMNCIKSSKNQFDPQCKNCTQKSNIIQSLGNFALNALSNGPFSIELSSVSEILIFGVCARDSVI